MKKVIFLILWTISVIGNAQNPGSGLILYLPFNGNANDYSGNGNNGEVYGPILTSDRFGNPNAAYSFDGIDDFIEIDPSISLHSPTNEVTISAWAYITGNSYRYYIVDKRLNLHTYPFTSYVLCSSTELNKTWQSTVSSAPIAQEGGTLMANSTTIMEDSVWYHIVGVYDSSNMKIYINGSLEGFAEMSGQIEYSDLPLYIGSAANIRDHFMNGIIDDVRIYNRALTQAEIENLYSSTCYQIYYDTIQIFDTTYVTIYDTISVTDTLYINVPVPISDLILYLPFNGNANDSSGNGNDGEVFGPMLTSDRFGNPNSAYSFDGFNDYILINNSSSLQSPSNEVTISAWAYITGDSYRYYIADKRLHLNTYPFTSYVLCSSTELNKKWQSTISSAPIAPEGGTLMANSTTTIENNVWYHIVGVYDSSIMKIYINGSLEGSAEMSGQIIYSDLPLYIGSAANVRDHFMNGIIDDVRIYNRALNQTEISKLYNNDITDNNPITENITIKVFPNPANNIINFNIDGMYSLLSNYSLRIINTNGQTVYETIINQSSFDVNVNKLGSKGLYFIQILDDSNKLIDVKKLILR